jgi:hypothetical protein
MAIPNNNLPLVSTILQLILQTLLQLPWRAYNIINLSLFASSGLQ